MARAMLNDPPMLRLRPVLASATVLAATLATGAAGAQVAGSGPTVSQSGLPYPDRIVGGANRGSSTRPQNLNPLGISYQDCLDDMTLQFSVTLSGFLGQDSLQVWASLTSDCTATTDRGIGAGVQAVCWAVDPSGNITNPVISTPKTYTFDVRVQDIVGWQAALPPAANAANPGSKGKEACTAQATFGAVPIHINFLAINSSGTSDGTPYQYQINTDMVGPPAPGGVTESVGETIYNISWTPNSDSDTAGYDIYIDPVPGQETGEAGTASLEAGQKLVCPESGVVTLPDATSGIGTDGASDGPLESSVEASIPEASAPSPYDGGCYVINTGGVPPTNVNGYNCNDTVLAGAITQDGGAGNVGDAGTTTTTTTTFDDAGNAIDSGSVNEGVGGVSTIPAQYLYGVTAGFTLADKSNGAYTIKGLVDGVTYTVVVASVDGTGNIGPPSAQVCDYPAPVKDFWQTYEQDGGAGSSFCALESVGAGGPSLAGVAGILGLATFLRRRRRSGR